MNDQYFWFDRQGAPSDRATDMPSYLDSLLYKPVDRYSYAQSTSSFTQFYTEGKRTGYGYSLASPAAGVLVVRFVEPLSPVRAAGLKRGDLIVSIDGQSASSILNFGLPVVDTVGVPRTFVVSDGFSGTRSFTANSAQFELSPVLDYRVLVAGDGKRIGYLAYNDFISSSANPLAAAVDHFRINAVQEVILDLRYNTGGSTLVAQNLSYLLGGAALNGQVFAQYRYNANNTVENFTQTFTDNSYTTPLSGLSRLFVLTSGSTASASEMVINGLRPYLNVITIGASTFGKPYAFQPRDACGITYNAVNLHISNALGFGDYAGGIAATCTAPDDLSRALGDPSEARLAAALNYVVIGACPTANAREVNASSGRSLSKQTAIETDLGEDGRPQRSPAGAWLERR
jgi:carboxyl-terminal processing protease